MIINPSDRNIKEEHITTILNEKLGVDYWIFELGVGYEYETSDQNWRHSAPYFEYGKKLWSLIENEVYELICSKNEPKDWVKELIEGDLRNLIIGIISAISAKYDIGLGIAIPITALLLKKGIKQFCRLEIKSKITHVDIKEIIKKRKLDSLSNK